ncbi:hypothetical protein NP493_382g00033 [Ridgeia piscesae]|uniref:Uncharacterized protein n=1 Tax=Ridgeia piscesae TaxID=27915 RepID=A0AAD9NV22_RIDPI|nr:hypothetical protein NP493_382g00033 [Ridgeia piscesae]
MPQDSIPKVALRWTPPGKRKRGRPKMTWRQSVMAELKEMGLSWGEAQASAKDRILWRSIVVALCPTGDEEDKSSPITLLLSLITRLRMFRLVTLNPPCHARKPKISVLSSIDPIVLGNCLPILSCLVVQLLELFNCLLCHNDSSLKSNRRD